MGESNLPPAVTELRLTGFKSYHRAVLPLGPATVLCGPSGAGKSNALDGLEVLCRLALGRPFAEALEGGGTGAVARPVRGGSAGCAPYGRRGFLLGCTVRTRSGPVRLDVAVEVLPEPRIVRERLTGFGRILLETPRSPREASGPAAILADAAAERGTVSVAWLSDAPGGRISAQFDDDRLLTAQLPLRAAGATESERRAVRAAEEVLVALRGVYPCEPVPHLMRGPATPGDAMLRRHADNIAAVLHRMEGECRIRHGRLIQAVRDVSPMPVRTLRVLHQAVPGGVEERLAAVLEEGPRGGPRPGAGGAAGGGSASVPGLFGAGAVGAGGAAGPSIPLAGVSDGLLRFLAFSVVLLTGPGVLQMDPVEVPDADRLLTVLAEDVDAGLAPEQQRKLLSLAVEMCERRHSRMVATAHDPATAEGADGVSVVRCGRDPETGFSVFSEVPGTDGGEEPGSHGSARVVPLGSGNPAPSAPWRGSRDEAVAWVAARATSRIETAPEPDGEPRD